MKFQPDSAEGFNSISRHESGRVWVGAQAFDKSLILPWIGPVQAWEVVRFDELRAEHFSQLVALKPEVVIFGSGSRLRFVPPALTRALIDARIGLETMDTAAACRTYNVLASERRSVVAALLLEA